MVIFILGVADPQQGKKLLGAYSTRERAMQAREIFGVGELEEVVLDTLPDHPPGHGFFRVGIRRTGEILSIQRQPASASSQRGHAIDHLADVATMDLWATSEREAGQAAEKLRGNLVRSGGWRTK